MEDVNEPSDEKSEYIDIGDKYCKNINIEEQKMENKSGTLTFKRLLKYSKQEMKFIIIGVIGSIAAAITRLSIPLLVGAIIDSLTAVTNSSSFNIEPGPITWICDISNRCNTPKELMETSVVTMCIAGILSASFNYLQWTLLEIAGERVVARLRKQLFEAILSFEVGFFDINKTGELINRLSSDTTQMKQAATSQIAVATSSIMNTCLGVIYLLFISWDLTLVMISSTPIIVISGKLYGMYYRKLSKTNQDILAEATEIANESISNIRTVKSFSKESDQLWLYHIAINSTYKMGKTMAMTLGGFIFFITCLGYFNVALVLWYGANKVLDDDISAGALTSYLLITITIVFSLVSFVNFFSIIMKALGAGDRIFNLLDRTTKIAPNGGTKPMSLTQSIKVNNMDINNNNDNYKKYKSYKGTTTCSTLLDHIHNGMNNNEEHKNDTNIDGNIEINNVSFRYPSRIDKIVLNKLSFKIKPGSITAIVGESGHGKSSIISLIMRFYDVSLGEIKIDGINIQKYNLPLLHSQIGFVSQEPILFARSIRDNILFGKSIDRDKSNENELEYVNISENEIISASKKANCHDFIMNFPEGYDTLCGERGVRLSGGQKQRVAIARAILMNPKILLLDEATSSLDAKSEELVQNALNNVMKGRTVLIIAHRLSTVKESDEIFVVNNGQIVERGKHNQLLQIENGIYSKLVDRQLNT